MIRTIVILDTSYTLSMFWERQLEQALYSRSLSGYFGKVISVHPLAGFSDKGLNAFGKPKVTTIEEGHIFIEGLTGYSPRLAFCPPINFICGQIQLILLILRIALVSGVSVVRIGDPYYLGILGLLLANIFKVPLAIRVGGRYDDIVAASGRPMLPRLFKYRWMEKIVERFVFPRCSLVAGANEDNMLYAIENGAVPDVTTVFRYGNLIHPSHWIDPSMRPNADSILEQLELENTSYAVTIARLEPGKLVEHTLFTHSELLSRGHKLKLLIIGDGKLLGELRNICSELGTCGHVTFSGFQNQEWIASVLAKASLVISPQMGRGLTECALASTPIAAYDYDWQRELIISGHTGLLVKHNDWYGLADSSDFLLTHEDEASKMGRNARKRVFELMDPKKLELHEIGEYDKIC